MAGLILFDGTRAYRAPGGKEAAAIYNTGTRVEVVQERSLPASGANAEERFYQIKSSGEPLWVEAKAVQIIAKEEAANELPLPFYLSAAKNKDEAARTLAAGNLMRLLKGPAVLDSWMEFQRDQADEVRCAANKAFSERAGKEGLSADPRFNDALLDALLRVRREGGWGEGACCGLQELLAGSSHPDKTALQCMLAQRQLGTCPVMARPEDKTRALELVRQGLGHPESWVRGNLIQQVCGEDRTDAVVGVLAERFAAMTPADKAAVINDCAGNIQNKEAARPLLSRIDALISDKSQPTELRLTAMTDARERGFDRRGGIRHIVGDPTDAMRFALSGRYCKYKDILEDIAVHGDDTVFASALLCLDKMRPGLPGQVDSNLNEWAVPTLDAGLKPVTNPERRAQLERRLKCLLGQALCAVSMPSAPN